MQLHGDLRYIGFREVLREIASRGSSGTLAAIHDGRVAKLVFRDGRVIHASTDRRSRLGYILLRRGRVTGRELEQALELQEVLGAPRPLGAILLQSGVVSEESMEDAVQEHIREVYEEMASWRHGVFQFDPERPGDEASRPSRCGLAVEDLEVPLEQDAPRG